MERYRIRFTANGKCEIQVGNFIKIGNSIGRATDVQTNYLLFLLMKLAKSCYFVLCKCNYINEQWTDKKKLGHVKQTDICHYTVYSNIILNLSISSCYMVNHTCDFKSKLAVCTRWILKSCIWFWTKVALSSILPLYMCLSFLLSISHSLLRSLSQYVIKGSKGTEAVCNTCYGWANLMLGMIKLES